MRALVRGRPAAAGRRKLARPPFAEPGEAHHLEHLPHARFDLGVRTALKPEPERDVLGHAHVRKERVVLKHHPDPADLGRRHGDVAAREPNRALVRQRDPAMLRSSVVFPQPEGPSRLTNSPDATLNDTPPTAWTLPNRTCRPVTSSMTADCEEGSMAPPALHACYVDHRGEAAVESNDENGGDEAD